jgi:uncharacterized DUF497 family protein/plasmid stabilization system protein ParE
LNVVWRDDARADVISIIEHIRLENPVAARQVGREILLAGDGLALFPRRGRVGRVPGTREYVAFRLYIIVYEIVGEDRIDILNIWHGAQDKPWTKTLDEVGFEWDEAKTAGNQVKHGVSFSYARVAFDDPEGIEIVDDSRDYGEERFNLIEKSPDNIMLFVSYTKRETGIRIISARRASRR